MRCLSCNAKLNDFEATRRGAETMEFLDLCDRCFSDIADDIEVIEREDLETEDGVSLDFDVDRTEY